MNPTRRFFRKIYLFDGRDFAAVFSRQSVLVLGLFLVSNSGGTQKQQFQISTLSEHIKEQNGKIIADGKALSMLKDRMAWAMLLDEGGGVIWEEGMPGSSGALFGV